MGGGCWFLIPPRIPLGRNFHTPKPKRMHTIASNESKKQHLFAEFNAWCCDTLHAHVCFLVFLFIKTVEHLNFLNWAKSQARARFSPLNAAHFGIKTNRAMMNFPARNYNWMWLPQWPKHLSKAHTFFEFVNVLNTLKKRIQTLVIQNIAQDLPGCSQHWSGWPHPCSSGK